MDFLAPKEKISLVRTKKEVLLIGSDQSIRKHIKYFTWGRPIYY